jgi:AcrR family transcriptional regulator
MPAALRTAPDRDIAASILGATAQLLARYGYSKTTIDDVAREAGIGKGSVYLHFASKEEIVLSLVDRAVREVLGELRTIAADDASATNRMRRMLTARVLGRMLRFRGYSDSLHDLLAALRPALLVQRTQHLRDEAAIFRNVINDGVRLQEFRKVDHDIAANAFLTATNSLLPYYLSARELGSSAAIGKRIDAVATLLLTGLTNGVAAQRGRRVGQHPR